MSWIATRWESCVFAVLVLLIAAWPARGLIMVGTGNDPVQDQNWPAGSLEVANLKTRLGWWEGPPFGGGQWNFMYRGDTAAFQEALDLFGKIRAPKLLLVVHAGPHDAGFLRDARDAKADKRVDWTFTVWNPVNWNHLYNDPKSVFSADDPGGGFRNPVDPPRIDVYVGGAPEGKGIDWAAVKVPVNITVRDERATAAGYPAEAGSVIRGEVFDMVTSKPIAAKLLVERHVEKEYQTVNSAQADAQGRFELKGVPAGSYRLTMTANGYVPRMLEYVQLDGDTLKEFSVQLVPPVTVKGTVVDLDGKPIAGATLRADNTMGVNGRGYLLPARVQTTSDDKGRFELAGVPKGFLVLHVHKDGYHAHNPLQVYPTPTDDLTLKMGATGGIRGKLHLPPGVVPGPSAAVNVEVEGGGKIGQWGGSMYPKPDGTFSFDNVPPGRYVVSTNAFNAPRTIEVKPGGVIEVDLKRE